MTHIHVSVLCFLILTLNLDVQHEVYPLDISLACGDVSTTGNQIKSHLHGHVSIEQVSGLGVRYALWFARGARRVQSKSNLTFMVMLA